MKNEMGRTCLRNEYENLVRKPEGRKAHGWFIQTGG